jgi:CO/xanthine dehydrogenase Mo-binding subunit
MTAQYIASHPLVGTSATRLDAVDKVTGSFQYGVDTSLPGMLHAKIRRSEVPHALIVGIDTSAAARLPGVHAILTAADIATVAPVAMYETSPSWPRTGSDITVSP